MSETIEIDISDDSMLLICQACMMGFHKESIEVFNETLESTSDFQKSLGMAWINEYIIESLKDMINDKTLLET